ncbi:MATE family efflux transporter [Bacteroidia bacterium]|nr:MATE family efflux transporter [Bacteroidia bacterium]GHT27602.1 MATE family efflux transporter [Bacteroidia bacterium]GHT85454.1 MATE family efflux transporter [Bacteroidia bacterium]
MKNESKPIGLGTEKIGKLLIQYAIPAIIAMTASSLYNITDSIFIGHGVGPLALSGLAITFPLMNLGAAFGSLVGVGASTLLSIRMGQKDYETANDILGNVFVLNLIMGIGFSILILLFLNPILVFFGAGEETLRYAHDFMVIILTGNVVTHMYFGLNALLRSAGNPKKAMMATIYTVLINLVLNPLFIFGFKWGIRGSAFATIISQIIVLCWLLHLFNNKDYFIHWKRGIYKLKKKIVFDSLSIGMAPFLMNAASCLIVILINQQLIKEGSDLAVGAYGIVNRVAFLFVMIVIGLNQGMQPIAGYNYGAKLYPRVIAVLKKSILFATIIMIVGFTLVELFPHAVASIFTTETSLIDIAVPGLRWVFICYPLVGFQMVSSAFFQSIGKANKSIILSMTRQVLFLIPILLILPKYWGITGVWASMTISDFVSVILAAILLWIELKNVKTK